MSWSYGAKFKIKSCFVCMIKYNVHIYEDQEKHHKILGQANREPYRLY